MRNNCGILAYDELVGQLNGRTNNISLDTLAKIAQDNGFILFPMRVPIDRKKELKYPFILHNAHHFETLKREEGFDWNALPDPFYVLSSQCIVDLVVTETEARGVKGGDK
jgi:ABC-type bacteriocin/lantibiotic exporter with double-glycine peptidase domain